MDYVVAFGFCIALGIMLIGFWSDVKLAIVFKKFHDYLEKLIGKDDSK